MSQGSGAHANLPRFASDLARVRAGWAMGRYGGRKGFHSSPSILGVFGKGATGRYLGVLGVLIPLAVSFYYTYIEAWCLGYFWEFATGGIGIDTATPITE